MARQQFLLSEAPPITSGRIKHLIVKGVEFPSTCTPTEIKELCMSMMAHIAEAEKTTKGDDRAMYGNIIPSKSRPL